MSHHLNTCVTCRDWGREEMHADHWPPRTPFACDTTIRDGALICTRTDDHLTGHTFESSWCPDAVRDEETVKPKRGAS